MNSISNDELIKKAESALNSQKLSEEFYVADVGCALVSTDDEIYTGACIGGNMGIHAEQSAFNNLVTKSAPKIKKIVAVWKNEQGKTHVIPPCGLCREFMRTMSLDNLTAEVILGPDNIVTLKDLLPYAGWYAEEVA